MPERRRPELVIAARGVSKAYETQVSRFGRWLRNGRVAAPVVEALHEVDLEVDTAEFTALAGPSGSGNPRCST